MNGLTLVALLAVAVALVLAWRVGVASGRRSERAAVASPLRPAIGIGSAPLATPDAVPKARSAASGTGVPTSAPTPVAIAHAPAPPVARPVVDAAASDFADERARLVRSLMAENARLAARGTDGDAETQHLAQLAEDRRRLLAALATARTETARYRALVVDLENHAPPPLLGGPDAPDDLRLIVGVGPVLARMLQQMGITTYRQIARWTERDIDDFEARLPEFPGRIRRDAWVTQARALHQSKYDEVLSVRDR